MRIRQNSEFANSHYLEEVCILNQNPRDILGPWIESQSQSDGEDDDFCGLASFGNTVKDLLREIVAAEEGKDKAENERAVYCSFTDASGFSCGAETNAGSQYCEVHVQLPTTSRTCSGTSKSRAKRVKRRLKRKKEDSIPAGDEIVYYAGFPGLRRKRGCPQHRSEQEAAATVNKADESN
ncbi:hypothetical protein POM88_031682 [Heracleum sosnowskyi]|uniref:Uncharacterized protein n=1 Tax=Heracleum sosnowskyi TaxID=360622 RepID=A0AAD8HXV6_9APIA|nr:hypothetical protein POM88_031682 [Heracleum sosnowskyi]